MNRASSSLVELLLADGPAADRSDKMALYGRLVGDWEMEAVQIGKTDSGASVRWSFTDITEDSFRWLGERSLDAERTWQLQAEFRARRLARRASAGARQASR